MTVQVGFRKSTMVAVAGVTALALVLTACGKKSDATPSVGSTAASSSAATEASSASASGSETGSATASATASAGASASSSVVIPPAAKDFKACMVTDTGGIDDKSFNAGAWAGMQASGATVSYVQSKVETDYPTNITQLLGQKCKLIVTVGGLMYNATADAAKKNPTQKFAEVDAAGNGTNVRGLQFNTAQAAFLGGYLAAAYSKTGVVATYGGLKIDPVTIYMDGFVEGVAYFNKQKGKTVKVLGWDEAKQDGSFAGSFTDQPKGQQLANNFIQDNADVILPVAGGTGLGSAAAAKSSGNAVVIWVDSDGFISAPQYKDVFLSTVFKNIADSVQQEVSDASNGKSNAKDYIGTLDNGGVGLSPFHDFDAKVDSGLKSELDAVKADIISGKIVITSPAAKKVAG